MQHFFQNADYFVTGSLLVSTVLCSFLNFARKDILAILILVTLGSAHILSIHELFWGFRSETAIVIIATSIIFSAFKQAGLHVLLAKKIYKSLAGSNFSWFFWACSLLACSLATVLRSIGASTVMLQVITLINRKRNVARGLLLPTAYMSVIGGTLTILGSLPFLLANDLLLADFIPKNLSGINHLSIFILGFSLVVTSLVFITVGSSFNIYQNLNQPLPSIDYDFIELTIDANNTLCNKTIKAIEKFLGNKVFVIAVKNLEDKQILFPRSNIKIEDMFTLAIAYPITEKDTLLQLPELRKAKNLKIFADKLAQEGITTTQIIVTENCKLIGHTYRKLNVERKHKFLLHTLMRHDINLLHHIKDQIIKAGDTLIGLASNQALNKISKDHYELLIVGGIESINKKNLTINSCSLLLALVLIYGFGYSVALSLLAAAGINLVTKTITAELAYIGIHWRNLFIIIGQLALAAASIKIGLANDIASYLAVPLGKIGILANILIIAALCSTIATITSPIEASILLLPIGIFLAPEINISETNLCLLISFACLNSFLIPNRSTYALIYNYGSYKLLDFIKVGKWMTLLYYVTMSTTFFMFFVG